MTSAGAVAPPWLPLQSPIPGAVTAFCLPYAGGGASIYRTWTTGTGAGWRVCPVQLPGREGRLREAPHRRMADLVADLLAGLGPHLAEPYILFGHSMGAAIAFEWALHQQRHDPSRMPAHLVLSARRPPHVPPSGPLLHRLADEAFRDQLQGLRGTPEAVLSNRELMVLLMPLLRADFELIESYHRAAAAELDVPCTVLGGLDDEFNMQTLQDWALHLRRPPQVQLFPGGHFFLHEQRQAVLTLLGDAARCASLRMGAFT